MKKETRLKLENVIRRLIREESQSGKVVTIAGDRRSGRYKVKLVRPRPDLSQEKNTGEPEEIWEVIMLNDQETEYVIKYDEPEQQKYGVWGELDPFIKEDLPT